MDVYSARRQAFMERIGPRAVALIPGATVPRRNADVEHRFRQASDLWFLTGFAEPDAFAVLAPGRTEKFVLFVRPRDPDKEVWTGRRAGVEGARARYGADLAHSVDDLAKELPTLLDGADEVLYVPGEDRRVDELVMSSLAQLRSMERRGKRAPTRLGDLRATLHEMRLIKDADALERMRKAAAITRDAHVAAMKAARPGAWEYQIEALIDYTFRHRGGMPGYGTIVGAGDNATILHYVENDRLLERGQLLLVDAGCELEGFTADVTRTYPVGAPFSAAQRKVYELVLETEKRCIEAVRPGATIDGIHDLAIENLTRGMVELGLLKGEVPALIESGAFRRFYMHRTSHWLGMDVHDVGAYSLEGRPRPLEPGMVLTVEPGLYIAADAQDVPEDLRGIGVRIEDDILVTPDGHENLTADVPKEIADVEGLTAA